MEHLLDWLNVIRLFMTGDFQGPFFGLMEDSETVNALFLIRDAVLTLLAVISVQY